MKTALRTI